MALDLIPNLKSAWVEPGQSEPVSFGDYVAPESFSTFFTFADPKSRKEWDLIYTVKVSPLGTPKLSAVEIVGNRSNNPQEGDREGVERWQLKVVEQYRTQLLTLALRLAISTRWPTVMLRREYTAENVAVSRALTGAGQSPNAIHLEHPSTVSRKLPSGEVADFVRFWDGNPNPLTAKELKDLQNLIGKKIRKKITNELLKEVARIYSQEDKREGGKPTKAVQDQLPCSSHRTAQDYVRFAREAGYLPALENKKVATKGATTRKGRK
jgi:hypothetical protein